MSFDPAMVRRAKQRNLEANEQRKRMPPPLIIPGWIDDSGFTPVQFRVLCRIARRCGKGGQCYESLPGMAKGCRIRRDTVQKAIKELVKQGWITKEERDGESSIYRLTPHTNEELGYTPPKAGATYPVPLRSYPPVPQTGYKGVNEGVPSKGNLAEGES